jgi:chromosome segregation protein
MYLKRLDIQGFKTFAGRTALEFRPGISAIVGPNGSGKSNLADAVRWVLGEQSNAALRCKRTEELIYSGGGRRGAAGLAEVSLTIDNSDRFLPIDFDEVTIGRRATRAGDNEYFINRARVRLRDVLELTEPLGGSYTIINQGLVDAALTLRPEERRKLFEDAAEIGGFDLRKSEALRRLRETDQNLQRVQDVLGELEPRLRALKRQATQARQHAELSQELRGKLERSYGLQWRAANTLVATTGAAVTRLTETLEQARAAQATATTHVHALRAGLRRRREALAALHQQSSDLHRRADAVQRELAVMTERLAAMHQRNEDLERRQQALDRRRDEAREQQVAAEAARAAAEADVAERRATLEAAEAQQAQADAARRELEQVWRRGEQEVLRIRALVVEHAGRIAQMNDRRSRMTQELAELETAREQAQAQLAAAQAQVQLARSESEQAEQRRYELTLQEQALRADRDRMRADRDAAEEGRAAARRRLADVEARYETLERLARSYTGTFAGVRAAMQWAESSGRHGFALVRSILHVPAELETAIEVALGSRLQHIIVDYWEDAEATIAELKQSGAGRATFLPLDTLRTPSGAEQSPVKPDGAVLGLASDLLEYDQRYAPAIRQLLGRVIIVADLATARAQVRRLPPGWNCVTLGGEQVQSGGALTGGAQTRESGTLRRERELRELPDQIEQARSELQRADARFAGLEQALQATGEQIRANDTQVREAMRVLDQARGSEGAAVRRVDEAEREVAWADQRRDRLYQEQVELDAQLEPASSGRAMAEQELQRVESDLAQLQARRDQERADDETVQQHVRTLRAALGASEGQLRAQQALLQAHAESLRQVDLQQVELEQAGARLRDERSQIEAGRVRAETGHSELLAVIDQLRAQIEPGEAELQAEEQQLADAEQAAEQVTAALLQHEAEHNRAALEAQRAVDRQEALYERAVADAIDPEQLAVDSTDNDPEQIAALAQAIEALRARVVRLGAVNPLALEEYDATAERQRFLREQVDDLRQANATLHELIAELDTAMASRFTQTFNAVAAEFEQSFTKLFGGGSARLMLVGRRDEDETDGANQRDLGVEIIARPPGKKQQNISLLSGGERALTAAALLFAILKVNPSPFCFLDETDAALDESNVGRFRDALRDLSHQTQFILITHNRGTIEGADTLYGVSMGDDGASRTISLRVEDYVTDQEPTALR